MRRCVCDLENLKNEEAMTRVGSQRHRKKNGEILPYKSLIITFNILFPASVETSVICFIRIRGIDYI